MPLLPGPALPLGELGKCLRPQVEGRLQNFRKEGIVGGKKLVSDESKKIRHIFLTKKYNFCYTQLNIGSTKKKKKKLV